MKTALAAALVVLTAYGGGGSAAPRRAPQVARPPALVVIGNSITRHPPRADVGWTGDCGMAASDAAHDFAHLTAAALGLPVDARNFSALETGLDTAQVPAKTAGIGASTAVVVVQLGDNAGSTGKTPTQWRPAYRALLDGLHGARALVCVTTFWRFADIDAVIRDECAAHGGRVAEIGDIYLNPANADRRETVSAFDVVDQHPHDWGMARIAERVAIAARQGRHLRRPRTVSHENSGNGEFRGVDSAVATSRCRPALRHQQARQQPVWRVRFDGPERKEDAARLRKLLPPAQGMDAAASITSRATKQGQRRKFM